MANLLRLFKKNKTMNTELSSSEAIMAFCAWLTTRKKITKMGSSCDCAPIIDRIKEFEAVNNLPPIRDNYTDFFKHPSQ